MRRVVRHDPLSWLDAVRPFVEGREMTYSLPLSMVHALLTRHTSLAREPYLITVLDDHHQVCALAACIWPRFLVMSRADETTCRAVMDDIEQLGGQLSGVFAPSQTALRFQQRWTERHHGIAQPRIREALLGLTRVIEPTLRPGQMDHAQWFDRAALIRWTETFLASHAHGDVPVAATALVDRMLASRDLFVWRTPQGEAVAMANVGGRTPRAVRVSMVFTPPSERRRGYASLLVASLCRAMLHQGYGSCTLFVSVNNTTALRLYQALGFEHVVKMTSFRFLSSPGPG